LDRQIDLETDRRRRRIKRRDLAQHLAVRNTPEERDFLLDAVNFYLDRLRNVVQVPDVNVLNRFDYRSIGPSAASAVNYGEGGGGSGGLSPDDPLRKLPKLRN
jgi:hypothetical protein